MAGKKMNSDSKPMPALEFRRFMQELGPISERNASTLLGMSRGFLRTCMEEGAPLYVAYACAAIAKGLPPYGIGDTVYWKDFQKQSAKAGVFDFGLELAVHEAQQRHSKAAKKK